MQNQILEINENSINKKTKKLYWQYYALAFLIPLFIITLSYALQGVYPLGDRHILTIDLYHQYAPFFRELRSKLIEHQSLFFTWTGGMGFNFFSVITYYLASPFNLLLLIFKESQLSDAVLLITVLKIATSGLAFYVFASASQRLHSWFNVAVSTCYALSSYSLAYSWNIMWLDTIILLPIVILGLERLIFQKKHLLYIISLTLLIMTNYYTGFFACIFVGLYFLIVVTREKNRCDFTKKKHNLLFSIIQFVFSTIVAVGISAITLLPTIQALVKTSASGDKFPDSIEFFEPFIDFISRLLVLSPLSIRNGMPNIYMGVLAIFLIPLYFLNKRINSNEKNLHIGIIIFLIISMNNNVLNFVWHGFHYPNQLPFRNSFILVFLLCSMMVQAYRQWDFRINMKWYQILAVSIFLLLLLQKIDGETYSFDMILISGILLFMYAMIFNSGKNIKISKQFMSSILLIIVSIEMLINSSIAINSISENEYYGTRDGYLAGDVPDSIREKVEYIRSENPLYRASMWPDKTVNDPMLYGYPGITIFASTYPEEPVQLFKEIGYDNNGINSYQNTGSNIILDSIFGLKYKIVKNERNEQVSYYEELQKDDFTTLYENPYALSLIFEVPNQASNTMLSVDSTAFKNQKTLIQTLGGDPSMLEIKGVDVSLGLGNTTEKSNPHRFQVNKESGFKGQRNISFDFIADEAGYYTSAWNASGIKFSNVKYLTSKSGAEQFENEISLSRKDTSISDLGYLDKGTTARITFEINDDSQDTGSIEIEAARINEQKMISLLETLKQGESQVTYHNDNQLTAKLNAKNNGYALFTTTYDNSWNITVNGEEVEVLPFDNSLILIPIKQGENVIEAKFVPSGFTQGLIISFLSIMILIIFPYVQKIIIKRKLDKQIKTNLEIQKIVESK